MRGVVIVVMSVAVLGLTASGQIIETGKRTRPSEQEIIDLLGRPTTEVFAKFGYPQDVSVHLPTSERYVRMVYGDFGLHVRDKKVCGCRFLYSEAWSVRGVKFFDATADIEQKLGKPERKITNADGSGIIEWKVESDRRFKVVFDKDRKCVGMEINEQSKKK